MCVLSTFTALGSILSTKRKPPRKICYGWHHVKEKCYLVDLKVCMSSP